MDEVILTVLYIEDLRNLIYEYSDLETVIRLCSVLDLELPDKYKNELFIYLFSRRSDDL